MRIHSSSPILPTSVRKDDISTTIIDNLQFLSELMCRSPFDDQMTLSKMLFQQKNHNILFLSRISSLKFTFILHADTLTGLIFIDQTFDSSPRSPILGISILFALQQFQYYNYRGLKYQFISECINKLGREL